MHGLRLQHALGVERSRQPRHVQQAGHRTAVAALLVALAQGRAAIDAVDVSVALQQPCPIDQRQGPKQTLFLQKLRKRLVGTMAGAAFEVQRTAPARSVVHRLQRRAAACAAGVRAQRQVRQVLCACHRSDQIEQRRTGQPRRLGKIEPDQVAATAQIDLDRAAIVAWQHEPLHRRATVAADQRRFGSAGRGARWHRRCGLKRRRQRRPAGRRGSWTAPAHQRPHG